MTRARSATTGRWCVAAAGAAWLLACDAGSPGQTPDADDRSTSPRSVVSPPARAGSRTTAPDHMTAQGAGDPRAAGAQVGDGPAAEQPRVAPGGQSGTDQGSMPCHSVSRTVALDDDAALGVSARDGLRLLDDALAAVKDEPLLLSWNLPAFGESTPLSIEVLSHGDEALLFEAPVAWSCNSVDVPLRVRVRSADGV